ncbi:hypothetical protein [Amycolatopsis sp. La24]|uniref:hypothetical protein n=1 Tax=Amycolatopsis sp. La24 TaxID=3028304 RepID=UPI0023B139E0|nr:hypothetical protein [Amycolatopsis sp. La24]
MTLARTADTEAAAEHGPAQAFSPGIDWGLNTDLEAVTGSREPSVFVDEHTEFVFACGVVDPVDALALIRDHADDLFGPEDDRVGTVPTADDLPDFRLRWCRAVPVDTDADPELTYVEGPEVPGAFPALVWHG